MGGIPVDGSLKGLAIMSDCKYGFRGNEDSVAVTLIRSSYNPDRVPDAGKHLVNVGVGLCEMDAVSIHEKYECYIHPIYSCANTVHTGSLAKKSSFLQIEGDVQVAALKVSEDKKNMILRVYSLSDQSQKVVLQLNKDVQEAYFTDVLEREQEKLSLQDDRIEFILPGHAVRTIRVN
jgi:alpha-mannosidase